MLMINFKDWEVVRHSDYDATYRVTALTQKFAALDYMSVETDEDENAFTEQEAALRAEEEEVKRLMNLLPELWELVTAVLADTEKFTLRSMARKIQQEAAGE